MQGELIDQGLDQRIEKIYGRQDLPNVGSVYYKGLFGMIFCVVAGSLIGLILVKLCFDQAKVAMDLYKERPDQYTAASLKKLKSGKTMAYIGIAIALLEVIAFMAYTA